MFSLPTSAEPAKVVQGDCLAVLPTIPPGLVDAVVSDPPYGLEFMGKEWDHGVPGAETWAAVLRTLRPGGYMVAMGGTRTYHRLACAIEDAGFEVRDCLMWLYGQGFPKGHGCLKPGWEPIILARRPGPKVLPLGVDECRVPSEERAMIEGTPKNGRFAGVFRNGSKVVGTTTEGRWPANVVHDGSDEVMETFAAFGEKKSGKAAPGGHRRKQPNGFGTVGLGIYGGGKGLFTEAGEAGTLYGDSGSAARFFYCAKPTKAERGEGNRHPTVKPVALMRWLIRLVCPAGGLVLDPFGGSGTTAVAALQEGRRCVLIEREPQYAEIARKRTAEAGCADLFAGV